MTDRPPHQLSLDDLFTRMINDAGEAVARGHTDLIPVKYHIEAKREDAKSKEEECE